LDKGLRVLSYPTVSIVINNEKKKLVDVVLNAVGERSHLVERFDDSQERVLIVDAVVELYVEFDGYHVTIGLLDEHRHLVVDDIGLACLVVAHHELWMFLSDQLRHETLNSISLGVFFLPTKQLSKRVVDLNDLAELKSISVYYNEACLVCYLRSGLCEVLLVDLVDLEDALHLADVELVGHGVVQDVELDYRELEVHLVVLEDLQAI
jgi:hypothetical protein